MVINDGPPDPVAGAGGIRALQARWSILATLELKSAAHLGSGSEGSNVDMALLRDQSSGLPLLTGTSIAGSLRSYLADRVMGYRQDEAAGEMDTLFGGTRGDERGDQSALITFDCIGQLPAGFGVEVRDGVTLDPTRGTAAEHFKYDLEALPPGTEFPLRFELLIDRDANEELLIPQLAAALR